MSSFSLKVTSPGNSDFFHLPLLKILPCSLYLSPAASQISSTNTRLLFCSPSPVLYSALALLSSNFKNIYLINSKIR